MKLGRSLSAEACFPHEATDVEPLSDEIDKVLREIIQRRGQVEFREKLLTAYNGRCPITGCDARSALEAAHIRPYSGASSCKVSNGLLLRADIHTLFDLNLFGIHPSSLKITLLPELQRTCFKDLNGKKLAIPDDPGAHPSKDALRERWKRFKQES